MQNGPVIITPGGKKGIRSNVRSASRTILAIDKQGSVYLVIVKTEIGLYDCQDLLLAKINDVDAALNLDGGPSTYFNYTSPQSNTTSFGCQECPTYFIKVAPK